MSEEQLGLGEEQLSCSLAGARGDPPLLQYGYQIAMNNMVAHSQGTHCCCNKSSTRSMNKYLFCTWETSAATTGAGMDEEQLGVGEEQLGCSSRGPAAAAPGISDEL